jgi:hypothetical protein
MSHDPATWTFPGLTAVDRQRLLDAATKAAAPEHVDPGTGMIGPIVFRSYPSELAASNAVLIVVQELMAVLTPQPRRLPRSDLPGAVMTFVDDVIMWTEKFRPVPKRPLPEFAADVHAALEQQPWWSALIGTRRQRRSPQKPSPERLAAERERIVQPLLDKAGWTKTAWAYAAAVDVSVPIGYMSGQSTPTPEHRGQLTNALKERLGLKSLALIPK